MRNKRLPGRRRAPAFPDLPEVLFEFRSYGRLTRVSAIDPLTNTEVIMVGAPGYSRRMLQMRAARKLAYVLARNKKNKQR